MRNGASAGLVGHPVIARVGPHRMDERATRKPRIGTRGICIGERDAVGRAPEHPGLLDQLICATREQEASDDGDHEQGKDVANEDGTLWHREGVVARDWGAARRRRTTETERGGRLLCTLRRDRAASHRQRVISGVRPHRELPRSIDTGAIKAQRPVPT